MTRKALIIGINYIGTEFELRGCIPDALAIQDMLINNLRFKQEDIVLMTEEQSQELIPIKANILTQIDKLLEDSLPGDTLFFHYSGHGTQVEDKNGDEDDGYDECIVPLDSDDNGYILDDDLRTLLVDKILPGVKLVGIMDCCCSGTGFDLRFSFRPIVIKREANVSIEDFDSFLSYIYHILFYGNRRQEEYETYALQIANKHDRTLGDIIMLSGCRDYQSSMDIPIGDSYGGAMTHAFLSTMKEYDYNPTCTELLKSVRKLVSDEYESPQVPQLSCGTFYDIDQAFI